MSITRRDMKHMAWAVAGLVVVIVGVSAIESGGLSWASFVGAGLVALYASAVVVAAIAFYSTYRRHNPHLPHAKPHDRPSAQTSAVSPEIMAEPIEEPMEEPVPPPHEERPAP